MPWGSLGPRSRSTARIRQQLGHEFAVFKIDDHRQSVLTRLHDESRNPPIARFLLNRPNYLEIVAGSICFGLAPNAMNEHGVFLVGHHFGASDLEPRVGRTNWLDGTADPLQFLLRPLRQQAMSLGILAATADFIQELANHIGR